MSTKVTTVYIQRRGLDLFLGPLELATMRAFWAGARSTRQAFERLRDTYSGDRTTDLRFTTVTTTITRLYERGFFIRTGDRNAYTYTPIIATETAFAQTAIRDTLAALFESYPRETGAILVELVRNAKGGTDAK